MGNTVHHAAQSTRPIADPDAATASVVRTSNDRGRHPRQLPSWLLAGVTTAAILGLWEGTARAGLLPPQLPPLSEVCAWLWAQFGTASFWSDLLQTLWHWAAGLVIGGLAGVVLGAVVGTIPVLQRFVQGTLEFLRPIPSIVYLPLFLLVIGGTSTTAITIVAIGSFWPMMFQTYYGVQAVDPVALDTGRVFNLTLRQRLQHIVFHSISPFIATGVRIASSLALIVGVSVELIGGVPGVGASLSAYAQNGVYPGVYGLVLVAGVLGVVLNFVFEGTERRVLSWHVSHREAAS